jgi:hypothetical protein
MHLELLWILSYVFSKEIKHISRINISDNHIIVLNSPEVYFGIERQQEEVGHKNIIIFCYKNHLGRFCRNGKQFLENDLHHNFMQCDRTTQNNSVLSPKPVHLAIKR